MDLQRIFGKDRMTKKQLAREILIYIIENDNTPAVDILKFIENKLDELLKTDKWISVKDELPKDNQRVLIWVINMPANLKNVWVSNYDVYYVLYDSTNYSGVIPQTGVTRFLRAAA